MNSDATNNAGPDEPDDLTIEREVAEEQDSKYGGRERWFLTAVFFVLVLFSWWAVQRKPLVAILFVPLGVVYGVWAGVNWFRWGKKSPAQKATSGGSSVVVPFKVVEHPPPFTHDEFLRARSALGLNMACSAFGGIFVLLGLL